MPGYRQCFVARSNFVCDLVERLQTRAQGHRNEPQFSIDNTTFTKLENLLEGCSERLPWESKHAEGEAEEVRPVFPPDSRVDFIRFKDEFVGKYLREKKVKFKLTINPSVAWVQIKSFIKGAIEALVRWKSREGAKPTATICQFLTENEYANFKVIGQKRCELDKESRVEYYKVFEEYQSWCKRQHYWDDVDRLFDFFNHQMDPSEWRPKHKTELEAYQFHNVYVDEVQDFTQIELALLLMLSGPDSLFLAGDNAQSVEEGVQFRFTEVRRVIFQICNKGQGKDVNSAACMKYVPEKHSTLLLNFRSHSGVLNIAKCVLDFMKDAFPNAIDQLAPDEGLCKGPRPMLLELSGSESLSTLAKGNEGIIMLTPDLQVKHVVELCGMSLDTAGEGGGVRSGGIRGDAGSATADTSHEKRDEGSADLTVIGIREAKGMEYEDVAIVNFFQSIEDSRQQPFKKMVDDPVRLKASEYPDLARHLKLLYTVRARTPFVRPRYALFEPTFSGLWRSFVS